MTPLSVGALPTLPVTALAPRFTPPRPLPFPLDRLDTDARLYYLARNGIYHGLRALGVGAGDAVLMPSYHHGVEVEAVRATGAAVRFYRVDRRMRADLDDVARLAGDRAVRALYITHYIGFAQPIADARAIARARGLLLVEDCALALFARDETGRPLGNGADLAVFCLYKSLPVPHGGVAVSRAPLPSLPSPPLGATLHHVGGSLLARGEIAGGAVGRWARHLARRFSRAVVDKVVDNVQTGTQHLDPRELAFGGSPLTRRLLGRIDAVRVATRRRRNYARLLDRLGDGARVPTGALPPGAVPLFLPVAVEDRASALRRLASRGIEAIDFWSFGDPACDEARFPDARWLRRHVIEVPLHQDLDDEAVDAVAEAVKEVVRDG